MRVINGKPEYTGMVDVITRVVKNEGVFSLWKGFTPYYMRLGRFRLSRTIDPYLLETSFRFCFLGPHTVLTFIFLEQMTKLYKQYML